MEQEGSKQQVSAMLATYRERGAVNHVKTLSIPPEQRIPELIKQPDGRMRVSVAIAASLASAFGNIERVKMDSDQLCELAEAIVDSAHEDQLSIEDILLFLRDLLMGKYGKVGSLDMPGFFDIFEKYRSDRYKALEAIRYETHLNNKNMGHAARSSGEISLNRDEDAKSTLDLMQTYYSNE